MFYIAVDGGGTKTALALYQDDLFLEERVTSSIHYKTTKIEEMYETLVDEINYFIKKYQIDEYFLGLGLAGYGNDKKIRKDIEEAVFKITSAKKIYLTNDAVIACLANLEENVGINVISGTGSIAFKIKDGILERAGGYGHFLSDEGSAYWIAKEALNSFTKEADGRLPKASLYKILMREFKLNDPYEIIDYTTNFLKLERDKIASIARILERASDDLAVLDIFKRAGYELALLANSFKVEDKMKVSVSGSVLENNQFVLESFLANLNDNLVYQNSNNKAYYGALKFIHQEMKKD